MSNKILIKRGLKASMPTLDIGEFGLATDTNEVFIGTPTGNKLVNSGAYSIIPPRYVQTTVEDFNASGDYIGTEEYIILPADKPSGYQIVNLNVKGVATNGDYLTSARDMFYLNNSLFHLELDYLDTSNVTDMSNMFRDSQVKTLDLSSFDTSKVVTMSMMFYNSQATTLDLSSFDTSRVNTMYSMFYNSQATTLDVSNFDTSRVADMESMFRDTQVTTLDLSSFDTSKVVTMSRMFQDSQATTGYARTQTDADKFNNSSGKPSTLNFVVKGSGGVGGAVDWQDIENKPELYDKNEIDLMLGDIENALDAILGV